MPDHWHSDSGVGTGAVYGFSQFLLSLIEQTQCNLIACCYDESLTQCFRNQVYPDYKANREEMPDALSQQIPVIKELTRLMGLGGIEIEGSDSLDNPSAVFQ